MKRIRKTPKKHYDSRAHKVRRKGPAQRRPLREEIAPNGGQQIPTTLWEPYQNERHWSARPIVEGAQHRHRLARRKKAAAMAAALNPAWI